jgi:hypothetical protein
MEGTIYKIYGVKGTKETFLKSMIVPYRLFEGSEKLIQELSDLIDNSSNEYDLIVSYTRNKRSIISKLVDNKQRII